MTEQRQEAERKLHPDRYGPVLLPATYEWIKRMDRDIGIFDTKKERAR